MKLREEIQNIIGEWLSQQSLSIPDDKCQIFENRIMQVISKRAKKIDIGELIKSLMWEKRKSFTYGDISEYVENNIIKQFK